jgi:hypothetical protein
LGGDLEAKDLLWKKHLSVILTVLLITFFLGLSMGWTALVKAENSGGQENMTAEEAAIHPIRVGEMFRSRLLGFIPNQGQSPLRMKYQAVSDGNAIILTPIGVVIGMPAAGTAGRLHTLRLGLVKPNPKGGLGN